MSTTLRWLLVVAAFVVLIWTLRKIRRLKVKMEDSIFWVVFSAFLLVLAVFPRISYALTELLGIQSPANLIFLLVICILIEKLFTLSILVSQLEDKVSVLSAEVAIRSDDEEKRIGRLEAGAGIDAGTEGSAERDKAAETK